MGKGGGEDRGEKGRGGGEEVIKDCGIFPF